jgi:UDP-glucuronate 4-epimerase
VKTLLTGAAGFIALHVAERLLDAGHEVVGVDNLNAYYDVSLKEARLARLLPRDGFRFERLDLADRDGMATLFARERFGKVVHLGAQPGVRHSLDAPFDYVESNLTGHLTVLEGCRRTGVAHLVYASSSSVYGLNATPFRASDRTDHPVSLYGATKKANEVMTHAYAHLFGVPSTGLRFFTVYGPWGRPDMATMKFTRAILAGEPIEVYGHGEMKREPDPSWTPEAGDPASSSAPHRVFNIGNGEPVLLTEFIRTLEGLLGRKANLVLREMQPGDLVETSSDTEPLARLLGAAPHTPLAVGLARFVDWYREYYRV